MEETLHQRLEQLRRRGNPGVAPLWAEHLSPGEFLSRGFSPAEPWVGLMTARALAAEGRFAQARESLQAVEVRGAGIELLLRELEASLPMFVENAPDDRAALLEVWLANVLIWRAKLDAAPASSVEAPA